VSLPQPRFIGFWPEPGDPIDETIRREPILAVADDGALARGIMWTPPHPWSTAVVLTHPRADFSIHYACPFLAAAGYAAVGFATRYVNNDIDCLHELAVRDVAAMVAEVRRRGASTVVLLGNSGGGSLMCLAFPSVAADGFVALAAHPGEGRFMLQVIDPSVTDEDDPLSVDPTLDMYNPDNGWQPWPSPCTYDRGWLARYRDAQHQRVGRIDQRARAALADRNGLAKQPVGSSEWRRAALGRYLVTYRTLADPAYLDLTIDPDDRALGTIFAPFGDPLVSNYGWYGLGRVMTPRGWLSTWSGLSSPAEVAQTIGAVTAPTLVVHPTADTEIRTHQARAIHDASGAADKTYVEVTGATHYLGGRRPEAMGIVIDWLKSRWP
jgi:alpha-beta hydrolase superfamily lysophospholipase